MDAYARLTNRREREYLDQLLRFVPLLDREYLKDFYEKQQQEIEKQRKKSESQSRKGAQRGATGRRTTAQRRR
jgi:hypothetical protein